MKKTIASLKGTKTLNRDELKKVNGGVLAPPRYCCEYDYDANGNLICTLWVPSGYQCP